MKKTRGGAPAAYDIMRIALGNWSRKMEVFR